MLLSEASILVAGLAPVYARVADALGVPPDQLNLEGACVVGDELRWFQRGVPSAGAPSASVDVALDSLLEAAAGSPAAVRVAGVRRYDLGHLGACRSRSPTRSPSPTDWCWSRRRPRTPPRPTTTDRWWAPRSRCSTATARRPGRLPLLDGVVAKVEGLALAGQHDDLLDLVAVVDADDPEVPSLLLELAVAQ